MHSVLFVGEAISGPVNQPTIVDWTFKSSINDALRLYGESLYEPVTITTSTTGCSLSESPWTSESSFIYLDSTYKSLPLPNVFIKSGYSALTFNTLPIVESTSGWVVYRKTPTNKDLTWALRRAVDQANLTPSRYNTCGLLRVVSSDAIKASIEIGTLVFSALSPGQSSNNILIKLSSEGLVLLPPPNISLKQTTYKFTQPNTEQTSSDFKYLYQLIEAIQQDGITNVIPITVFNNSKLTTTVECYAFGSSYPGNYYLENGDNGSDVTIEDIYNSIENIDLTDYEVIAFCGRYGREIFPLADDTLFKTQTGFPFQLVCNSSGSINSVYASKSDSFEDRWQSSRFCLVNGELEYGDLLSSSGDLIPSYSVILTSKNSWHGFCSRTPIAGRLIEECTEKELLSSVGVVTIDKNRNIPVIFKGVTTDTELSPIGIACLRGVCRGLFPSLYDSIGKNISEVLSEASTLLEYSLLSAKSNGCPIIDYVGQASIYNNILLLDITLDIAGQVEAISAQVAIPVGK